MNTRHLLLAALALAGCKDKTLRSPCASSQAARLEIRDSSGALELALKDGARPGASDLCDASAQRVGGLVHEGQVLTLFDRKDGLVLRLRQGGPDDFSGEGPKGPRLRVHRDRQEVRVVSPDGIPFGSVVTSDTGVLIYNKASAPIASVEKRDEDLVVKTTDGAVTTYLVPSASPGAAGMLAVEGLPLPERLALYVLFSQNAR